MHDRETTWRKPTFESFVAVASNLSAFEALKAWAANLALGRPSLVLLWGPPGVGKSHLARAAWHTLLEQMPWISVRHLAAERWMSWYVMALHSCRQDSLLDSLLRSDVLIIEHLEFIEGKDRTCEELFRLIRGLRAERRPVLLSADTRSGEQMPKITERLAAEFTPATVTAIDTPTLAEIEVIAGVLASRAGLEQRGDDWWRGCHNVGEIIGQMTSRAFGRGLAGCTESNSGGDAIGGTKKQ